MDKGYDYPEVYELLEDYGYTIHIRLRGEHRVIGALTIPDQLCSRYQDAVN
jgi:hypothetical protein